MTDWTHFMLTMWVVIDIVFLLVWVGGRLATSSLFESIP